MLTSQSDIDKGQAELRERFEGKLRRLKEALRVREDQDVAAALGMSKAAFSARKARHSFPDDSVLKLQQSTRPNLNVFFVLFGAGGPERDRGWDEMDPNYIREWVVRYEQVLSHSVDELYSDAIRHPRVQKLLNHLVSCSDSSLEQLIKLAERLEVADAKDGTVVTPFTLRPSFHREIANAAPSVPSAEHHQAAHSESVGRLTDADDQRGSGKRPRKRK